MRSFDLTMPPRTSLSKCGDDGVLSIDGVMYNVSNLISPKSEQVARLPTPKSTQTQTKLPTIDNATSNLKPAAKPPPSQMAARSPPPRPTLKRGPPSTGSFRLDFKSPQQIHAEALLDMFSRSDPNLCSGDRLPKEFQKKPPSSPRISDEDNFRFKEAQKRLHQPKTKATVPSKGKVPSKEKDETPTEDKAKISNKLQQPKSVVSSNYPVERTRRLGRPPPRARSADTPPNIERILNRDIPSAGDTSPSSQRNHQVRSDEINRVRPTGRPTRSNSSSAFISHPESAFAGNIPRSRPPARNERHSRPPPNRIHSDYTRPSPPRPPPPDRRYGQSPRRSNSACSGPRPHFPHYDDRGPALRRTGSNRTIDTRMRDMSPTSTSPRSRVVMTDRPFSNSPRKSSSCFGRYNNVAPLPPPPLVDGNGNGRRKTRSNSWCCRNRSDGPPPQRARHPQEDLEPWSPSRINISRSPYSSPRKVSMKDFDVADCRSACVIPSPIIEIEAGVFEPLRGSQETLRAVQDGEITPVNCICCQSRFHCIKAARYVICPACKVIGPVPGGKVGVGLGFYHKDIPAYGGGKTKRRSSDRSTGQMSSPVGPGRCFPDEPLMYGGAAFSRDFNFAPSRVRLDTA